MIKVRYNYINGDIKSKRRHFKLLRSLLRSHLKRWYLKLS